jgi:hypothetical protein
MQSTVTGLTGEYTITHPERVAASEVIEFLEQQGNLPYRSISRAGGVTLQIGGEGIEVKIDGMDYEIVIFQKSVGVIPR